MISNKIFTCIVSLYSVIIEISGNVICPYYPSYPALHIVENTSCTYTCCQNIATQVYQACCSNASSIAVTYLITFGLLLGCCSLFSVIGFIISCCKYDRCRCCLRSRRILSSHSNSTNTSTDSNRGYSENSTNIDLPPSYGDLMKPEDKVNETNNNKDRSSPPPPYRINIIPINDSFLH